jgi:hypothetical protein
VSAELMIEHEVGVTLRPVKVPKFDSDYFEAKTVSMFVAMRQEKLRCRPSQSRISCAKIWLKEAPR